MEADQVGEPPQQFTVELHEYLHHDLQLSSGWGLVSGMALLLSRNGWRSHALAEVFDRMVDAARETHEVFATTLSATVFGVDQAAGYLEGNEVYLGFLRRGLALAEAGGQMSWQFRHSAIAAVAQVCMRPRVVFELLETGFGKLGQRELDLRRDGPDRRLAAFERAGGAGSWRAVFEELRGEYPEEVTDEFYEERKSLPEESAEAQRLRVFQEEVLNPRCHAHVRQVLEEAGFESIGTREQSRLATALHEAVAAVDPELAGQLELVRTRLPLAEEASAYARQRIRLRDRITAEVVAGTAAVGTGALGTSAVGTGAAGVSEAGSGPEGAAKAREAGSGPEGAAKAREAGSGPEGAAKAGEALAGEAAAGAGYVCGLWLDREIVREQFEVAGELPELVVALQERSGGGVRLRLRAEDAVPQELQRELGGVPLLVLTSHRTLAKHAGALRVLQRIEPVHVLMDLPIARHVGHWIAQGATVRCALTVPEVPTKAALAVAVFMIGREHPFVFFTIGGESATYLLVQQLQQRHPGSLVLEQKLLEGRHGIQLAIAHVLEYWHTLGQLS